MKHNRPSAVLHAATMLCRNIRSYAMLSVTILLSFSILLGYLAFVDSSTYNRYKEVFAAPRNIVVAEAAAEDGSLSTLISMAKNADPEVSYYAYFQTHTLLYQYGGIHATLICLPEGKRPVYERVHSVGLNFPKEAVLVAGRSEFSLTGSEAIINEDFYQALGGSALTFPFPLEVPYEWADGSFSVLHLSVVGVCEDTDYTEAIRQNGELDWMDGSVQIYMTQSVWGGRSVDAMPQAERAVWFCSEQPEQIESCAGQLQMVSYAVCSAQNEAMTEIQTQKATKAVIAAILLLVLGVNLFSSFSNALAERRFEIGVKRAIGASAWNIVLQFLLESILVMLLNIFLSVTLVADGLAIYKIARLLLYREAWIVSLSGYSLLMFAVSSISITVLFSALFAYQATQVEIVQQLKHE